MKHFLEEFRQSAFTVSHYVDVVKKPFSYSFKYFSQLFFLFFALKVVHAMVSLVFLFGLFSAVTPVVSKVAVDQIPANFSIHVANGQVNSRGGSPVVIPFSERVSMGNTSFANFLVVDLASGPENFLESDSFMLLTKNAFTYSDSSYDANHYKVNEFRDTDNFQIDAQGVQKVISLAKSVASGGIAGVLMLMGIVLLLALVFSALVYVVVYIAQLIGMFVSAILYFFVSRLFGIDLSFSKIVQVAFHAVSLVYIAEFFLQLSGFTYNSQKFASSALFFFLFVIFMKLKDHKSFNWK